VGRATGRGSPCAARGGGLLAPPEFAARHSHEVVAVYADAAQSGRSLYRQEMQRLLADAGRRRGRIFNAVLVDDLSRLSRDMVGTCARRTLGAGRARGRRRGGDVRAALSSSAVPSLKTSALASNVSILHGIASAASRRNARGTRTTVRRRRAVL
jgi:hypothetical protein